MTAVREDEIVRVNPYRIPDADREASTERPTLTVDQVFALVDCSPAPYRALVLLATFASLRWGEVVALQRKDLDLAKGSVEVGAGLVLGPPKSRAGIRTVSFPAVPARNAAPASDRRG
jgi:integrase